MLLNKARKFVVLPFSLKWLFLKSALWILAIRVALRLLPFNRVREFLVQRGRVHSHRSLPVDMVRINEIIRAVDVSGRFLIRQRPCLTTAMVAQMMLAQQGYDTTLRIGVARQTPKSIQAHAWLEREGQIVIGRIPGMNRFTVLPPLHNGPFKA
jgi:hypothetical protein